MRVLVMADNFLPGELAAVQGAIPARVVADASGSDRLQAVGQATMVVQSQPHSRVRDRAARLHLDASRRAILDVIGPADQRFTLVRGVGNLGDQLIAAGARRLLAGMTYEETSIEDAVRSSGQTAVLMGSGA